MLKPKLDVVLGVRGNTEVIAKLKPDYLKHWLKLVPKWWIEDWGWDLKVEGAGEDAEERERMVAGGKEEEAQEVVEREEEEGEESRESWEKKRDARCWALVQEAQKEKSKRKKKRRVLWCEQNIIPVDAYGQAGTVVFCESDASSLVLIHVIWVEGATRA